MKLTLERTSSTVLHGKRRVFERVREIVPNGNESLPGERLTVRYFEVDEGDELIHVESDLTADPIRRFVVEPERDEDFEPREWHDINDVEHMEVAE